MANSLMIGVGASVANAVANSVNGVLDDEITVFIAMALNQLPRQLLMNSSVMFRIRNDLTNALNTEFGSGWTDGARKLGPGIVVGILADVAADGAEYFLVSRGVSKNSAWIVVARYWVVLLIDDAYALYSGGPAGVLATTISVTVGATLDQATALAGDDASAAASWQYAQQLSARVRMRAAMDDALGRHEMAAMLRSQADDADRTLALIKSTPLSVGWNPLGASAKRKAPFSIVFHRF